MIEELQAIGFNKNEALIYLQLVQLGHCRAAQIIKNTGFHRNIVYDNLSKLEEKGLITTIIEGKSRLYQLNPVENIIENIQQDVQKINDKLTTAQNIQTKLNAMQNTQTKSDAQIFRGKNAMRQLFRETLQKKSTYYVIGAPQKSVEIMGDVFWLNHHKKLLEHNIKGKMLFNEDLRQYAKKTKIKHTTIRFLDKHFDNLTEIHIQSNRVITMVWSNIPTAFVIDDAEVAKGYKKHFDMLWSISSK